MPLGIPHSEFLRWKESDQQKALDWQLDQHDHCQSCGTRPSVWLDDEGYKIFPPPLVVDTYRCGGCLAMEAARSIVPDEEKGIHFFFRENPEIRKLP